MVTYLAMFAGFSFPCPASLRFLKNRLLAIKNPKATCVLAVSVLILVLSSCGFFPIEHPFLLADNRHISFYLWRKLFSKTLVRCLIVPVIGAVVICMYLVQPVRVYCWEKGNKTRGGQDGNGDKTYYLERGNLVLTIL